MFIQVLRVVHSVGLTVVATSMDNFFANRKFYTELYGGKLQACIPNPLDVRQPLFLLFDAVHNFKTTYNNLVAKGAFNSPLFLGSKIGKPSLKHIERMYTIELGKPLKMAHKLKDKVMHPLSIEKTNVKLADAAFHESTINALAFYSKNGHPEFTNITESLKVIRKMWNITNIKTLKIGQKKMDDSRHPSASQQIRICSVFSSFRLGQGMEWPSQTVTDATDHDSGPRYLHRPGRTR